MFTIYNALICLPIKIQPVASAQQMFQHRRDLDLAYSWIECEVDQLIGSDFIGICCLGK